MYPLSRRIYIRLAPLIAFFMRLIGSDIYARMYGRKVYYDPRTDVGDKILKAGNFERAELSLIGKLLNERSVALDIGANIGTHSLFIADKAPFGQVFSFEPSPATYRFLLKNVRGVANIHPVNMAASDRSGIATFHVAADNAYSGISDTGKRPIIKTESITTTTVDDFIEKQGLERLDLIKIDVEGHESQVLAGGMKTIQRYKPALLVEIFEGKGSTADAAKTVDSIREAGYDVYVIKDWKAVPYSGHDNAYQNYLFLPKGKKLND